MLQGAVPTRHGLLLPLAADGTFLGAFLALGPAPLDLTLIEPVAEMAAQTCGEERRRGERRRKRAEDARAEEAQLGERKWAWLAAFAENLGVELSRHLSPIDGNLASLGEQVDEPQGEERSESRTSELVVSGPGERLAPHRLQKRTG